jgi:hypothetical protein
MYRWELDGAAREEFDELPAVMRRVLAGFMDTLVRGDPVKHRRRPYDPRSPLHGVRTLEFGRSGEGLVTFVAYRPDMLVLVVRIHWFDGRQRATDGNGTPSR